MFRKSYLPPKSCNFATIKQYFPWPKLSALQKYSIHVPIPNIKPQYLRKIRFFKIEMIVTNFDITMSKNIVSFSNQILW